MLSKSITVKTPEGLDVIVPVSRQENAMMNCFFASLMRTFVYDQIKKAQAMDTQLAPKELKDLIDAATAMLDASGNAYKSLEGELGDEQETAREEASPPDVVDFKQMKGAIIDVPATPPTPTQNEQRP